MPSFTTSTTYSAVNNTAPASPLVQSIFKRKTMSITQTYYLAHKARSKLSHEAARPDHNLRLLVGHANMLDSLMLELADAEREQESWFNQSVRGASESQSKSRHVQWADTVVEEPEEDWDAEDAGSDASSETSGDDSDDGFDAEDDIEMADAVSLTRVPSNQISPPSSPETEDFEDFDDEEDYAKLALVRTSSHHSTTSSPPELDHDSDYSSEDEHMPPSPPTTVLSTFTQDTESASSPAEKSFYDDGYYLPPRQPATLVTAISVY